MIAFNRTFSIAVTITAVFLLTACGASKKFHEDRLYLKGVDSLHNTNVRYTDLKIQNGDLLTILVYSDNQEVTEVFNQQQSGGGMSAGGGMVGLSLSSGRGYLVDPNGQIYVHTVGRINAVGLTKGQLADSIRGKLTPYLKEPYVVVRYANSRFTILGEVNKPGEIQLPDERLTIFDALGLAGDMTVYAKRDDIILIREEDGVRKVKHLDLRKASIYNDDAYYVQQNDLIYVEPTRRKPTGNDQVLVRNVALTSSVLSTIALIITLITR